MSNNTQLPAEVVDEIKQKAEDYANRHINGRMFRESWEMLFNANQAGATEWAQKWWELRDQTKQLMATYASVHGEHQQLKDRCDKMEAALNEIRPYLNAAGINGNHWIPIIDEALAWKEKEAVVTKCEDCGRMFPSGDGTGKCKKCKEKIVIDPCPHCGKELSRDRSLCCRECGKEVERER